MLQITIPEAELFNDATGMFITCPQIRLRLEHSLLSISKWESKWKKPFLTNEQKTPEEFLDYIRCMTINSVDSSVYARLRREDYLAIQDYLNDPQTATTFHQWKNIPHKSKVITSELIYYWMVAAQIPFEVEKWPLNRLMTLIRVYSVENDTSKMSKKDVYKSNRAINQARRAKLHSKG